MNTFKITTFDNFTISATHFKPIKSEKKVILINSGTGIKQTFYFNYAKFLSEQGFDVITYDYRGIGRSKVDDLNSFEASMTDWASKDFQAIVNYLESNFAEYKKVLIGHSFGGNSIGMSSKANAFDIYITIASQFGYWRFFNWYYQPLMVWVFYFIMPILSRLYGYFPSELKGLGERLPKGVAFDWVTIITKPDSLLKLTETTGNYYNSIDKPMLMISFSDDQMAPKKAVDELAKRVFKKARIERLHITAKKSKPIGHVNFFKRKFETDLWSIPTKWMAELEK